MSEEEIKQQIADIEKDIELLTTQKKIKDSKCAICGNVGCDTISFIHKKPVHSICHEQEKLKNRT